MKSLELKKEFKRYYNTDNTFYDVETYTQNSIFLTKKKKKKIKKKKKLKIF
jgi:hypothetical protein